MKIIHLLIKSPGVTWRTISEHLSKISSKSLSENISPATIQKHSAEFTFHVLRLAFESIQRENNAADEHVGVHQRAVDLVEEHLELKETRSLTSEHRTDIEVNSTVIVCVCCCCWLYLFFGVDVFVESLKGIDVKFHKFSEQVKVALQDISGLAAAVDDAEENVLE